MTAHPGSRRILVGLLIGYVGCLAFFLLAPSSEPASDTLAVLRSWLLELGAPRGVLTQGRTEFAANVAIFVLPVALAMGIWPRVRWQDGLAYGFLASLAVEVVQGLFFAGRSATMQDVVANTTGAALGALLGALLLRRLRQRG